MNKKLLIMSHLLQICNFSKIMQPGTCTVYYTYSSHNINLVGAMVVELVISQHSKKKKNIFDVLFFEHFPLKIDCADN